MGNGGLARISLTHPLFTPFWGQPGLAGQLPLLRKARSWATGGTPSDGMGSDGVKAADVFRAWGFQGPAGGKAQLPGSCCGSAFAIAGKMLGPRVCSSGRARGVGGF